MLSPRHGQVLPRMGAPVGLVAFADPGAVFDFEYALYRFDGGGYVIHEWRPLGKCQATGGILTDVAGLQWQGCGLSTGLPLSDAAHGGFGAWRGDPANPTSPRRFARVRTGAGGFPLFVFPSSVSDQNLTASYNQAGALQTIITYNAGIEAEVSVDTPTIGSASFAQPGAASDVTVVGDLAYVARVAGSGAELGIFDVADAGNPQLVREVEIGANVSQVAAEGDYVYLATDDPLGQLVVVSVADPSSAAVVARLALAGPEPASAVASVGGTVLVGRKNRTGTGNHELEVWTPVDASQPANLLLSDTFEIGAEVNAIDVTTGLYVLPDKHVERTVAFLATSHASKKIRAVDVSDPTNVTGHDTYSLSGAFAMRDVIYHHGMVYGVADDNTGADLFIYQITGATGRNHTLAGSLALDANNTGVVYYADMLLVSTQTAAKALITVDAVASPPALLTVTPSTTGAAAVAVRHGIAHLATAAAAPLQLVSPGLQLEPTLPANGVVFACLGDSNTAQGGPECLGTNAFNPNRPRPLCDGELADCALPTVDTIDPVAACPGGEPPTGCPPDKPPVCALSWCSRAELCFSADPLAVPQYCSVEGRHGALRPGWSTVNPAAGFAPLLSNPDHPADGPEQVTTALAAGANAFLIALGSVDMLTSGCGSPGQPTFSEVLDGFWALESQAGGVPAFFAIPPPFSETGTFSCNECEVANGMLCFNRHVLRFRNRMLHELPPERIMDFHSGVVRSGPEVDFGLPDIVHFNARGQNKRARAALSKLAD